MPDQAPEYTLGYEFDDAETHTVYYTEDIAAGDALKVTGVEASPELHLKVAKHTADVNNRYIALFPGKNGERHRALLRGTTKVTFGEVMTAGFSIATKAGKFYKSTTSSTTGSNGYAITAPTAVNDTGLIYFDGARS